MTARAGVGRSHHHNPNVAGREAAEQALEKASVQRPDFVFLFATIGYDQHLAPNGPRDYRMRPPEWLLGGGYDRRRQRRRIQ